MNVSWNGGQVGYEVRAFWVMLGCRDEERRLKVYRLSDKEHITIDNINIIARNRGLNGYGVREPYQFRKK